METTEKEEIVSAKRKKWVLDTVEKLSRPELDELQKYLENLVWKSQLQTKSISNQQDLSDSEPKGQPQRILAAINKSHQVTVKDVEALLQSIKEGEIPIRFDSVFDESAGKN